MQAEMAISNPHLGDQMVALYRQTEDQNIKLLVKVFLQRAGEDWHAKVSAKKRRYRGAEVADSVTATTQNKRATEKTTTNMPQARTKSKRIYRGQVVE
ncbi:hypothetical protein DFR28_1021188 [Arenicella xantha]|uniref:Uncharacterized protein n=2 Tax=Arenicella xantha TaxID=644221 RepID=A0A395JMT9_9GAMM|nr:hypothetical protein DFR28_1021188 [Arenicella xantha]